ncbi:MAG: hypothetical protein HQK95_03125 [Nitrospirae bacterium]|nr:hypothetical protein [Nitrospirota bacterium]
MKKVSMAILTLMLAAGVVYAADFATYTTDELLGMRGTMYNATVQQRTALHTELTKRVEQMTPEQKQEFASRPASAGRGRGMGYGPNCPYRTY